jgi:hypothetical protein
MHKLFMTCAAAATGLMIAFFLPSRAQALTIATPASLAKGIHDASLVQNASYSCRRGWHPRRCAGTPVGYLGHPPPYAYSFYRPEPYYAYGYYQLKSYPAWWWGWRQPWWW